MSKMLSASALKLVLPLNTRICVEKLFACKMSIDIGGMRFEYKDKSETFLEENLVSKEPFGQFNVWFQEASKNPSILEANAMLLATATKDGYPSSRFVLCKGYGKEGFKFYTNYESRKAEELRINPNVAATFYWDVLKRCIRIEGYVEKLSVEESDKYFHSRPVPSQIAACASRQSTPIESRDVLCEREKALAKEYMIPGREVPKPDYCSMNVSKRESGFDRIVGSSLVSAYPCGKRGGYIIRPRAVEFWQGQSDRLHDRIKFRRLKEGEVVDGKLLHQGEDGWVYERLSP